jgi:hypothetical protein
MSHKCLITLGARAGLGSLLPVLDHPQRISLTTNVGLILSQWQELVFGVIAEFLGSDVSEPDNKVTPHLGSGK